MFSFLDSKTSSAKLSEWSPTDWPESLSEMRTIDNLLRCSICYEFFNVALMIPDCSHNYCSLCIRRSLSYEAQCPTCSFKVNPPSLRSNRVLDELVKNFVQVRAKLLEIVKGNSDLRQSDQRDSKAGQQDKTNSNAKRRKLEVLGSFHMKNFSFLYEVTHQSNIEEYHTLTIVAFKCTLEPLHSFKLSARPSSHPKCLSPHFKRQKLNTEEDVHLLASRYNETQCQDSETGVPPDAVEVVSVRIQGDVCAHQSAKEDKFQSSQSTNPMNSDIVECPVCGELVQHSKINSHVDVCLTRTEKKRALRSKKNPNKSKTNKKSGLLSLLPHGSQGSSGENIQPSGVVTEDSCPSTASTSTSTVKGSNALIQPVQKRKPLPKLVYSVMAEKELRQRLKEWNLSTKGDKSTLIKRHQDFVLLYNVQCDSTNPMTATQVANEVEKAERKRSEMASSTVESSAAALHFDKDQSEEDMDKARQKYLSENQHEFNKLIADMKQRRSKARNTSAKNTVTKMPEEGTRAPIKVINQPDTPDFGQNTDPKDAGETSAKPEKCCASYAGINSTPDDFGGYAPIVHENANEAMNTETSEASIVPEPPSSPSVALFEEEDELTPSLGLDDKEWDEEDDEPSDANVIAESPVIKVGKRSVEITDRRSTTSESDEEFYARQSFSGNKTAKSRLF